MWRFIADGSNDAVISIKVFHIIQCEIVDSGGSKGRGDLAA